MTTLLEAMLWVVAVPLACVTAWLLIEVLAALPRRREAAAGTTADGPRPRVGVLIPAHDEAGGIVPTLRTILPQLREGDRLLVVADNCSDATAQIARDAGAEVVERHDTSRRGKGYALDAGIRCFEASAPPDVILVVDADCTLHPGSLELLARTVRERSRPAQALDMMHAPPGAGLKSRIAAFAWAVKNHARPLGLARLGLPCQLMGTGMAFPWPMIRDAQLASGHIVEDMRLGIDLAGLGFAPLFVPDAQVSSQFPSDAAGVAEQRARWEQGHLAVIVREVPQALGRALVRGRPHLAAMALDLCVPPLAVLVLLLVGQALLAAMVLAAWGVGRGPLALSLATLVMLATAVFCAWARFGRGIVSLRELLSAPLYVLGKLPMYARFIKRRDPRWVRARRDPRKD